ncbi:Sodium/nucleoside cotransporter [Caenorhabditis elegans]|uniref:Sodium/nucleoside cotransporter n=2 Tax=Caenorhabditis elegans TaxID=6239 RepID=G5EE77_CAEEL|nr:Sodium/nucleoside cotransporter [Caenorhabditis elegans]AAF80461.1 CNT-like nucleoside transporter [Caenorhabditis elegans]CCD62498.1 Sodium/nucleoside cotransporter [Caenorhabditis elegans]|eukprot:NP_503967.1 Sodium/nucleoside cotransporter [Caenorhabditis elegans]
MVLNKKVHQNKEKNLISVTKSSLEHNANFYQRIYQKICPFIGPAAIVAFLLVYHGYLIAAGIHNYQKASPLIYVTLFFWLCFVINFIVGTKNFKVVYADFAGKLNDFAKRRAFVPITFKLAFAGALFAYTIVESLSEPTRLTGFGGYVFFVIFMVVFSNRPRKINWNIVTSALIFHYCLALIVLKWPTGRWFFDQLSQLIIGLLEYAQVGAKFVFGFIAGPPNICDLAPVFIFTSLQTLIYFSAVVALLFYFGIIQIALKKSTWFMKVLIGTTPVESVYSWACTFLGQTEAPLVIKPYLEKLTDSELFAVLTSGFSCTGGTVFAAYVALGACPESILTASILSAPMSLACSKLMYPEEQETIIKEEDFELDHENEKGFFDTLCSAGVALVPTVFAIGATLVVVMSLLALLDQIFFYIGDLIGYDGWSFQMLFGYAFFPLAYIMGITNNSNQTLLVAQLMGSKTAVNEFVAYDKLGQLQKEGKLDPKSVLVATYALCGFSNFGSMGIQMEVIGGLAPGRKTVASKVMLRALCAGAIACFMNATVAGILISDPVVCNSANSNSTCFRIPS